MTPTSSGTPTDASTASPTWASLPPVVLASVPADGDIPSRSYRTAGDRFLVVEYGRNEFDLALNFYVHSVLAAVASSPVDGIRESMPGFRSIVFALEGDAPPTSHVIDTLEALHDRVPAPTALRLPSRIITLPVAVDDSVSRAAVARYTKTIRPDAANCAGDNNVDYIVQYNGLADVDELAEHLTATQLWVGFIGFFPGLPFMFPLDSRNVLFAPKYNPTRTWTQEGAVGLGGPCYSIYPVESPGGYQLLGRTIPVYDIQRRNEAFSDSPLLLRAGDRVQFELVGEEEIDETFAAVHADRYAYDIEDGSLDVGEHQRQQAAVEGQAALFRDKRDAAAARTPVA